MPFVLLPTVLMQSIMQQLDLSSLLRFARCNRSTLVAACSDVAFRFAPPLALCSLQRERAPLVQASRLLRHVAIDLTWVAPASHSASFESISGVFCYPRLHGLRARLRGHLYWHDLLRHSSLRQLRVLSLDMFEQTRDTVFADALALLTELREVVITCAALASVMEALASLPRLTCLDWTQFPRENSIEPEVARHLSCCVRLNRITLRHIWTNDLSRIITERMAELAEFTLVSPSGIASLNCLNLAPNLREATFVLCLTAARQPLLDLRPNLSLRLVTFVMESNPLVAWNLHRDQIQLLLAIYPQVHICFEMGNEVQVRNQWRIRVRNQDIYASLDRSELRELMVALDPLCALDPQRVSVTQSALMQTPEEEAASLRERFATKPKKSSCCIV